jgi:putative heme iron utilization protein
VLGSFRPVVRDDADEPRLRRRFLLRHPKSELYAGFADFGVWRMNVVSAHLNGGFARAADLAAADLLSDFTDAAELAEVEESAIAHLNADHAVACRLYATRLLQAPDGAWRCVGISPEGVELQLRGEALWLPFPQRIKTAAQLRATLKQLADEARRP